MTTRKTYEDSKRKEKQQCLKEQYQQLFNTIPSGVAIYKAIDDGADFVFVDFNPAAEKIDGVSKQDVLGKRVTEVFPGVKDFGVFSVFQRVYQTGQAEYFPRRLYMDENIVGWRENWVNRLPNNNIVAIYNDVTERKKSEETLKEKTGLNQILLDAFPCVALLLRPSTREIVASNRAAVRVGAVPGKTCYATWGKRKKPCSWCLAPKVWTTGEPQHLEVEAQGVVWDAHWIPVGKDLYMHFAFDITERKKLETTIKEAEKRYHALFDRAPLGIMLCDKTATAVEFNEEAHRQLGYTREEFKKLTVSDYEVIETPEETKARMKKIMREGRDEFETKHRTKNGEIRDVIIAVQLIELAGKTFFHLITRDVTEQKKVERALKIEKEKLEAVTENIGAGLGIVNKDYSIVWANKLLREDKGECEGKKCYSIFNQRTDVCPDCGVKKIFDGSVPIDIHEYSNLDDKGNRYWLAIIATPLKDENGNVTAALELVVNITERKIMENQLAAYSQKLEKTVEKRTTQLKEANEKLLQSQRLATIGELAAMVGHDLRNPLTGIKNAAYYLEKKGSTCKKSEKKMLFKVINSSIDYANKVVNDLLEYSGNLNLELEEKSLKVLLSNALSMIQNVPEKTEILIQVPDALKIKVDEGKIIRVFANLIQNAIDAMPNGGVLKIVARQVKGNIKISFADTGEGIPEELTKEIFTPLFTTKAKGMGFGLSICKRIIEAHGGNIDVESKLGHGTTFTVTLPMKTKTLVGS